MKFFFAVRWKDATSEFKNVFDFGQCFARHGHTVNILLIPSICRSFCAKEILLILNIIANEIHI